MTIQCLIHISTSSDRGYAEVVTNDLHQLAIAMPGSVITYEIQAIVELPGPRKIIDDELFAELSMIVAAIGAPRATPAGDGAAVPEQFSDHLASPTLGKIAGRA